MTRHEHLYLKLMEECAEVQQRVSKLLQFGSREIEPGQALANDTRLRLEINDLLSVIDMLERVGFQTNTERDLECHIAMKSSKIFKYRQYSEELGCVAEDGKEPRK